jgi:S1-C subfamily serine protease
MDRFRHLLVSLAVVAGGLIVFAILRKQWSGYGLLDFIRAQKPPLAQIAQFSTGGPSGGAVSRESQTKIQPGELKMMEALDEEFSKLSAAVLPSVVSITTKAVRPGQTAWHPLYGLVRGRSQIVPGLGSGAIISAEGLVVTNHHVIADVTEVIITTNDHVKYPARILGASRERDIALLKIESDKKDFPALNFANSDSARVGQIVFAIGNPFGLNGTVTQGIISARDRQLSDSQMDYLQTDTVINPGNSGGPLVNLRGEILGINVAIYRGDENVHAWQGVGLAVPANEARAVVEAVQAQLSQPASAANPAPASGGEMGYLGLVLSGESVILPTSSKEVGAYVTNLDPESPAAKAGIQAGDVILNFNGAGFRSPRHFLSLIRATTPGQKTRLEVVRDGQPFVVQVTISKRPEA